MILEEYRMHSSLYKGRSFATFPLVVLGLSLGFSYITLKFSTLGSSSLGLGLEVVGGFLGLAVGSVGFSGQDAMKNVLGPVNLLVYSSRTLPISQKKLLFDFIVKDIIYYTFLFMLPVASGPVILSGLHVLGSVFWMFVWFAAALLATLVLARTSLHLPATSVLNYKRLSLLKPLADKSILDIARSSGGLIKIFFSLGILTGFYWFLVLYFPIAQRLLTNPLISFSIMLGVFNISIYNWLNRFDSLEKYIYLPVDRDMLLQSKKKAYLAVTLPLTLTIVVGCFVFYRNNLFVSLLAATASTLYSLAVISRLTGLQPNKRLFNSKIYVKFLVYSTFVVVPLLIGSIIYQGKFFIYFTLFNIFVLVLSLFLVKPLK
jgi:hypothetical protein